MNKNSSQSLCQADPVQDTTAQVDLPQATAAQGDPVQNVPAQSESVQTITTQGDPVQNITAQSDPVQTTTAQSEPIQTVTTQGDPVQTNTAQSEPVQNITAWSEPAQTITAQGDPVWTTTAQSEPVQNITAQSEPVQTSTAQSDPVQTSTAQGDPVQTNTALSQPVQNITAQSGATVNSSFLQGNEFYGPVYIGIGADSKHEAVTGKSPVLSSTATPYEDSVSVSTAEDQKKCTQLKSTLGQLYESILIGNSHTGHTKFLEDIYTDLIIVQNESGGVIQVHEVMQMDILCNRLASKEVCVKCSDLFKVQPGTSRRNRKVLTMGIAGVGKTVSVNKFILDWSKGEENQDITFIFPLSFRELNQKKEKKFSLIELLNHCFFSSKTELKCLPEDNGKILFIFDGLDECCFPLCFEDGEEVKDVNEKTSVGSLVTNLINRNLLPFALVWITCRPAAACLIPRDYINLVTEVRGFNDEQKQTYFSKYCNKDMAMKIVSHIKKSRSLYIMCQIPVFCWISATVLQPLMVQDSNKEIPATLTGMYISFLLQQKNLMKKKYSKKTTTVDAEHIILKLGKLAFCNLESGTLNFYEDDLKKCGIDVSDGTVFSGVCTQIFSQQGGVSERNVFSFVHLSVQESLAALYVHHSHCNKKRNAFKQETFLNKLKWKNNRITDLHKSAVKRALQSEKGHLDLFLRFLLGLSLGDTRHVLSELLPNLKIKAESVRDTADYIKKKLHEEISSDRRINLFHCLSELKDNSLTTEIQEYLNSGNLSTQKLASTQWSALVFVLLMSEETREKFELKKYRPSEEGLNRLLQVVKHTGCALLASCNLGVKTCEDLVSVLNLENSSLKELDLSNNDLEDSGVELLSAGLKSSQCNLEILRLALCNLGKKTCNHLESVLKLESSSLKELDISNNDLQDSGVEVLSAGLKNSHCKLEILRLSGCMITEKGCAFLASALRTTPSNLKELDLTYNHPGQSGVKLLTARLEDPHCSLNTLRVEHGGEIRIKPGLKKYSCELTLDPNTAHTRLSLSNGNRKVEFVWEKQPYPDHPKRFNYYKQVLCRESLTGRCYWEAEWSGCWAEIAVTYKSISRKGRSADCRFGLNEKCWSLICCDNSYSVCHNNNRTDLSVRPSSSKRVGVYVDCPAGNLSFYSVSSDTHTLTHLHTVYTTFTELLCAGFTLYYDSSVCV
ncbi:NACHT, LRR and PYD domains-containing protein 12-like [Colossoma macropomum]|uniref:NACHT, LRR and PYD domains-containing protein 12-like n=1 Tax=Colossoma macropomum TaxID=42526 RepID=UPI001863EE99|nr:NACHT, LRR and PYD domains-containing protein 12-like [Colossoma macropomum]